MISRLALALVLLVAVGGCDRDGVEPLRPGFTVQSPNLDAVLTEPDLTLSVRADGSGQITAVRIAGQDAQRDGDLFSASLTLKRGLTAIPIEGLGDDGERVLADTAYALFALPQTELLPTPPGLTGGGALTLTTLPDGRVLVAGGEPADGASRADATLLRTVGGLLGVDGTISLREARYNHSATLLPDGSVLLIGGSRERRPRTRGDFAQTVERIVPGQTVSQAVPFTGGAPQRSGHVARLVEVDGEWILYLIGGVVPGEPPLTTPTVDVLRFEPGSEPRLTTLSPPGGAGTLPELPAPILLDLRSAPSGNAASALYGLGPSEPAAARLTWAPPGPANYPVGLRVQDLASPLATPRTNAASAALPGGLFLVSGGQDESGAALGSVEALAPAAGRAFAFDAAGALRRGRFGHAATSLGPGRMLTLGGYDDEGFPVLAPEITTL